ncbi:hypothetical protein SCHPADRAFT_895842 [Schizopora paradoxa]|uniref:Uncharacterized protein n=1 Tax=Schizopora paradoxa TaxID=27342 RepID=A0A0H2R939_9AGAM|nr:hypothetical protein SCHPADRAFT_895842 [Schizopora paradoxa]
MKSAALFMLLFSLSLFPGSLTRLTHLRRDSRRGIRQDQNIPESQILANISLCLNEAEDLASFKAHDCEAIMDLVLSEFNIIWCQPFIQLNSTGLIKLPKSCNNSQIIQASSNSSFNGDQTFSGFSSASTSIDEDSPSFPASTTSDFPTDSDTSLPTASATSDFDTEALSSTTQGPTDNEPTPISPQIQTITTVVTITMNTEPVGS